MRRLKRQLNDTLELTINPAEEGTLQDVRDNAVLGSAGAITKYVAGVAQDSHTAGATESAIFVQNTGGVLIRIGGSNTDATTGWVLTPYQGFLFNNIESGWTLYFIRDTSAGGDGQITFLPFIRA